MAEPVGLFALKALLFFPTLGAIALILATEKIAPKILGAVLFLAVLLASIFISVVALYGAYSIYVEGIDGFGEVLLLILYVLSAFSGKFRSKKKES